ncbi:MAG: hypothetical protein QMD09_04970, partial [Desulfatibacillaceae bacterium]|nr:hypothetical protein [Desulfatibacillaceae bacterium]
MPILAFILVCLPAFCSGAWAQTDSGPADGSPALSINPEKAGAAENEPAAQSKREKLLKRGLGLGEALTPEAFQQEIRKLGTQMVFLFTRDFLKSQNQALTQPDRPSPVFLLFVLAGFSTLCAYAGRLLKRRHLEDTPYRNLLFAVLEKSLPLAGAALFVFAVGHWQGFLAASSMYRAVTGILVISLFILWAHEMAGGLQKLSPRLFSRQALALWDVLVLTGSAFALGYFLLARALPVSGPVLVLWRQI